MERMSKTIRSKNPASHPNNKSRNNNMIILKEKSASKQQMLQHLIHPDYILFDWEFYSNQLEFE